MNVDADVTMDTDYFARLVEAFEREARLGIAGGSAWEPRIRRRMATAVRHGGHRLGRDARLSMGVPPQRAASGGAPRLGRGRPAQGARPRLGDEDPCRSALLATSPAPKEPETALDGRTGSRNGHTAHFMGYRPSYLPFRTLYRMRRDRAACALVVGYVTAALRRAKRLDDPAARAVLRRDQSLRKIVDRRREARGTVGHDRREFGRGSSPNEIV